MSLREMPAPASKMEEWVSPMKSEDTTCKTQNRINTTWKKTYKKQNKHKILKFVVDRYGVLNG